MSKPSIEQSPTASPGIDISHAGRGELRIYLGAAPGVGKTYAMLSEGRRRRARGTRVVVGWVNTRGRPATTEQIQDLPVILPVAGPTRDDVSRDGIITTQATGAMDIEGIIAAEPEVVLVDDLAESNPSWCTRSKHWEDVEVLLESGIDVIATLNIEHLESLADVVFKITGRVPHDTIPDAAVRSAAQIELVDMTPEAIVRRMAHGNIYQAGSVDITLANYFRPSRLAALRELALLWVADRVDESIHSYADMDGLPAGVEGRDRVVVALTGAASGEQLVRRAARMAFRARGDLIAVHVLQGDGLKERVPDHLAQQRQLVVQLGGSYHEVHSGDVAEALVAFAKVQRATRVVLGASHRSRVSEIVFGSVINKVIRGCGGEVDVHVISTGLATEPRMYSSRWPLSRSLNRPSMPLASSEWISSLTGALMAVLEKVDPVPMVIRFLLDAFSLDGIALLKSVGGRFETVVKAGNPPGSIEESTMVVPLGNDLQVALAGSTIDAAAQIYLQAACILLGLAVQKREQLGERFRIKAVEEGDKLRSALLAAVSHDFRTPLASIKTAATGLMQPEIAGNPDSVHELLTTIDTETDRLEVLVSNLLDMGRIQAGSLDVRLVPVTFDEIISDVFDHIKADVDRVTVKLDDGTQKVMADPALLQSAMVNLLRNALAYSPPDTTVVLEAGAAGDKGCIRVVDFGPGISRAYREDVFKPFQRLGDAPNGSGVGLGLAVARGFIEMMHGGILLDDTPGGGCTATVVLPANSGEESDGWQ
ncbi:MAG: ATP-binding protein [Actinobacteria bacterium]|nr:ATP-binding protein [Actinomycetota bacterium]